MEALNNLGVVYARVSNHKAATEVLLKVVAQAPAFAEGWLNLGVAARGDQKFAKAEAHWKKALELDPAMVDAWYNLGVLYLENELDMAVVQQDAQQVSAAAEGMADFLDLPMGF